MNTTFRAKGKDCEKEFIPLPQLLGVNNSSTSQFFITTTQF